MGRVIYFQLPYMDESLDAMLLNCGEENKDRSVV
jgi:hypothetical protein